MFVKEIVIDGFKSYAKRTVIALWDPQFNCITGLNGSGKSNILDAICFVLGITSMSTVRAQNQQDLIYKRGQAGVTKASVSIVFDNTDKSKSPLDYRDAASITVTRQVVLGGTSKYLVNGHRAQQAQVQQLFQEVQLNVNNPNFLIMQGQITKVLNMRPTEILGLIEEAAGTGMYEKERVRAVKEIRDRDAPLHETESLLNEEVRPKLEIRRRQKRDFLAYQQCAASTESLERVVIGSQYTHQKRILEQKKADLDNLDREHEELKVTIATLEDHIHNLKKKMNQVKMENHQDDDFNMLDRDIQSLTEEHARLTITLEDKQQLKAASEQAIEKSKSNMILLEQQLLAHKEKFGAFEEEHALLKSKLQKQHETVIEKRELLSGLRTGISTTGDKETGYEYVTKRLRDQVLETKNSIAKLETRKDALEKYIQSNKPGISSKKEQLNIQNARLHQIETENSEIGESLQKLGESAQEFSELKSKLSTLKDEERKISRDIERLSSQYPNLSFPPEMQMDHVRGRLINSFTILPEHKNKSKALEVAAGGNLWNMVVDDSNTALKVLSLAKKKRLFVLPLDKLNTHVIPENTVKRIHPTGAWRAIDLVKFDEQVRPAIEYCFGGFVVCSTADIAKRTAFEFKTTAVTLEGDVFEPRGIISGGSDTSRGGANVFNVASNYAELLSTKNRLVSEIQVLQQQVSQYGNISVQVANMRNELDVLKHQANLTRERVKEFESQVSEFSQSEEELKRITTKDLLELHSELSELETKLQKSINDASEFTTNREGKLAQLMREVEAAEAEESRLTEEIRVRDAHHIASNSELVRIQTEMNQEMETMETAKQATLETQREINQLLNIQLPEVSNKLSQLKSLYEKELSKVSAIREELQNYENEVNEGNSRISDMQVNLKQTFHKLSQAKENVLAAQAILKATEKKYPRAAEMATEIEASGELVQGNDLVNLNSKLTSELNLMKDLASRVDASVVTMVERLEADEAQLRQRIATIRNDKVKLSKSMDTLNDRRRSTIDKVWRQVSKDFGLIFGDLLPGSSCMLVPVDGKPIEEGFSIRVRLGATWKEGLTELSGGQRSLVALSLILALLRYHPAPMYILDEVDAALDVHHTRNIGHIIKTRFQNAQFIVVSLKDDMFTNANRIFQTRFIDGTSTVHIMA